MLTIKHLTKIEIWDLASIFWRRWIFGAKEFPLQGEVLPPFLCWRWTRWTPWFATLRTQFGANSFADCSRCVNVAEPVAPASKDDDLVAIISLLQHHLLHVWGFQLQTAGAVRTACLMEKQKWSPAGTSDSLSLWSCSYYRCSCSGCFRAMGMKVLGSWSSGSIHKLK